MPITRHGHRPWRTLLSLIAATAVLTTAGPQWISTAASNDAKVYGLTADYQSAAAGLDPDEPIRFGWKLASTAQGLGQDAFRIDVYEDDEDGGLVWSSGTKQDSRSAGVAHQVTGLEPEQRYAWTATVTTSTGSVVKSAPATIITAAEIDEADWIIPSAQANGISMLRTEQKVQRQVSSALLYIAAMGVYDAYIDGKQVTTPGGVDLFNPGWTDYKYYANYQTYDVTNYIKDKSLTLGVEVAKGWYAGRIGAVGNYKAAFGPDDNATELGLIAKLVLNYVDGTTQEIVTDDTWKSSDHSPVLANDFWDGENYDANIAQEIKGWNNDGYDVSEWAPVTVGTYKGELRSSTRATARIAPEFDRPAVAQYTYDDAETRSPAAAGNDFGAVVERPARVDRPVTVKSGDKLIVDFGQNAAGAIELTVNGAQGTKVQVRHAEMLNDGRKNPAVAAGGSDGPTGTLYLTALKGLKNAYDEYTLSDEGTQTWLPTRTFHGFQYVEITADKTIQVKSVVAKTFTSVGAETGTFQTNDADINKLVSNTKWSQISNYLSIPTDCPQRDERAGWTGDAQLFAATGVYNYDVYSFFESYNDIMQNNAAKNDNRYYAVMPVAYNAMFATVVGSGWSDAGVIIPWVLYQQTGDSYLIHEHYAQMDAYMDYVQATGYATNRFGDWLAFSGATVEYMNSVYQIYTTALMEQMAHLLGNQAAVGKYQDRYDELKAKFFTEWVDADGNVLSSVGTKTFNQPEVRDNAQTALLWALKLGLHQSDEQRDLMLDNLVANIRNEGRSIRPGYAENTLSVGFLGVNVLLPVLADNGRADVAYDLLLQDAMPSWLYSVKNGATTIWERWNSYSIENSFGDSGMNSFNHYSYGAAVEWMYKYIAGINLDESKPGFQNIVLQPTVDTSQRITSAKSTYDSVYGPITSNWKAADGRMTNYHVELPANTTATLYLDVNEKVAKQLEATPGVTYVGPATHHGATVSQFSLVSGVHDLDAFTELPDPSSDATLSALAVSPGTLAPAFDPVVNAYQVNVASKVSAVTVTATPADAKASVLVNGQSATNVALAEGQNLITIEVTAENGSVNTYTVTVTREAAPQPIPVKVTVSFNPNGGSALPKASRTKVVTTGQTYGKLPTPKRTHHTFQGWYTAKSGGARITASSTVTNSKAHTLYARWVKQQKYGKVKGAKAVYVRASASAKSKAVGVIRAGNTFRIYGKVDRSGTKNDWYKVKWAGKTRYVHAKYVKVLWK